MTVLFENTFGLISLYGVAFTCFRSLLNNSLVISLEMQVSFQTAISNFLF